MARAVRRLVACSFLTACVALAMGCGSSRSHIRADGAVLRVTERDFHVAAPAQIHAGEVQLVMDNTGPDDHELIVVRSPAGGRLPMRHDGVTVDEDALQPHNAVTIEPRTAGTVTVRHLHLTPGRYTLFCNMSGHFLGGMHTTVVVR